MTKETTKGFNFNKAFQSDPDKEVMGGWTTLKVGGDEMQIKLARTGNANSQNLLRTLLKENERALEPNDDEANKLFLELTKEVMAKYIVIDWKDVLVDGKKFPHSESNCLILLEYVDFYRAVERAAGDFNVFRAKVNDKILKN